MKKIININLSGRVIPIEDSAYERLQGYIESLRRYFINEEGRDEIINDIESRIAELMSEKIRKGANAVTEADMEEIILSMGRVEDFEESDAQASAASETMSQPTEPIIKQKGRLYRNASDKILGGVAGGLANYLDVDPAVIRILMILFGFTFFGILFYIILWIILPARDLNNYTGKRLFRNPDNKVIAGVAGGLGAYFNIQAWIIRLILVSPLLLNIMFGTFNGIFFRWHRDIFPNIIVAPFTGVFVLAYIILWMVLPEARSPFEKMEMRGEKVDVNRIRQNVQEGMTDVKTRMQNFGTEVKTSAQELGSKAKDFANTRGKAWASEVAQTARPAARGIGHIIGVIFKAFFIFVVGCIALSLFAALVVLIFGGVASGPINNFLWTSQVQRLSAWGTLLFFITVPVVAFMTWLIRRVVQVRSRGSHLGWIFGGLWVIGWICAVTFAASIAKDLRIYERTEGIEVPVTQPAGGRLIVKVDEPEVRYSGSIWWIHDDNAGWDITDDTMKYNNVKIRVAKSDDSLYHARIYKYSMGSSLADAQSRANKIVFNASSADSLLRLSSALSIDKNSKFRGQGVVLEIEIPVGRKINFDESVIDAYNPWVVRKSLRGNRYWSRRSQNSDWDYDDWFNLEPGVDYVMNTDGALINPANPPKKTKNGEYHYNENDNQDRENRKRELQNELNEIKQQEKIDSMSKKTQGVKKESMDDVKESSTSMSTTFPAIFSFANL